MQNTAKFYIDGEWVEPTGSDLIDVVNPATEEVVGRIGSGNAGDVDRGVQAARRAFGAFSMSSKDERVEMLCRIAAGYEVRMEELAQLMTLEMGSPITFSRQVQVKMALQQITSTIEVLRSYEMERRMKDNTVIRREPIGVCGLITPWNWPLNQVTSKLAPAIAAGCTVILKPSELAPLSNILLAEIIHDAGLPRGVFNMINGDGPTVGDAIARHSDIDMVSFTGSTRAGISVARSAADTVKRVTQELGGKSPNIILDDADLETVVKSGVLRSYTNAGQACMAPTRMLVHVSQRHEALRYARDAVATVKVGDPLDTDVTMGPLVSAAQFKRVQSMIESGLEDGATLVAGGVGLPDGLTRGYFIRPTVFADVTRDMRIAREEIFGPVLSIMTYETEDEAISLANDTPYGLAGYIQSSDPVRARRIANRIRAGRVFINTTVAPPGTPLGGYKQSGNGRELGIFGFEEFLEVKAVIGEEAPVV